LEKLISDNIVESLHEQLAHELFNSHLYLYICGWLRNKGMDGLAKKFMEQHDEETEHSKIIFNLLTDLNCDVIIKEIDEVAIPFINILDVASTYLNREIITTKSLDDIKHQAMEEGNPIVEERIREMIKLQQHEYAEATEFMDRADITGGDWKFVLMWDLSLK
jgi:ferritin